MSHHFRGVFFLEGCINCQHKIKIYLSDILDNILSVKSHKNINLNNALSGHATEKSEVIHCMCTEMPIIPVDRAVDTKRIIGKNGGQRRRRGTRGY
jgi:hypothetical protein